MLNLVQREDERRYRADERELVEGLAQRAAAATFCAKLYRGLKGRSRRLTELVQGGQPDHRQHRARRRAERGRRERGDCTRLTRVRHLGVRP
jgi:GAF domain-containing protein